ncbi:unnamed protein product [Brachionus calyciflorus]|uniref:Uncharacterized protein n=1 Tax=Brachionus calyciflorus TaxID=104777 RepID=A0A813XBS0_9BILA|nr:unnamed protein product [Brachionus calyciflorus]
MSYYVYLNQKTRELIHKIQDVDKDKLINKAIPVVTGASYLLHSAKFMAPNTFSKLCGDKSLSISKALFLNSIFGGIFYIFTSKHMKNTKLRYAIGFSAFESVMFNFGTILTWSLSKVYLPDNEFINLCFGLLSGAFLLYSARNYLKFVDNKSSFNK